MESWSRMTHEIMWGKRRSQKKIAGFLSWCIIAPWASLEEYQRQNSEHGFLNRLDPFDESQAASNMSCCASVTGKWELKRKTASLSGKERFSARMQNSLLSLPHEYLCYNEKHAKYVLLAVPETKKGSASWGVQGG